MNAYFYIALTVLLTVYGQIVIKFRIMRHTAAGASADQTMSYMLNLLLDPYVISGLAAAFLAACTWMLAVNRLELSKAYPFVALGFVLVPVASSIFLGESLSMRTLAGAAIIVVGIAVSAS